MTVEHWIDLLVPVIGIIVATASAGLTYYFAKKQQIAADESRLKEKYYLYLGKLQKITCRCDKAARFLYSNHCIPKRTGYRV